MLGLMGWKTEPLLFRRLGVYIVEGVAESATLACALVVVNQHLTPPHFFARMIILPLSITGMKLLWAVVLAFGYFRVGGGADIGTLVRRMGCVHSRAFWTCSQVLFTCASCMLMVWHAIVFLLLLGYRCKAGDSMESCSPDAARFLLLASLAFCCVHWGLWRDFVQNVDLTNDDTDITKIERILEMYKTKAIRLVTLKDIADSKFASTVCAVCLDDFSPAGTISQLPCGHHFHPTCAHLWMCQDWRCPLRCDLDEPTDKKFTEIEPEPQAPPTSPEHIV